MRIRKTTNQASFSVNNMSLKGTNSPSTDQLSCQHLYPEAQKNQGQLPTPLGVIKIRLSKAKAESMLSALESKLEKTTCTAQNFHGQHVTDSVSIPTVTTRRVLWATNCWLALDQGLGAVTSHQ